MPSTRTFGSPSRAIRRSIVQTERRIAKLQRNLLTLKEIEAKAKTLRSALDKEETTLGGKRNMELHRGRRTRRRVAA